MTPGKHPTTLTLLATYQCTAACENCCFASHPGIEEKLPLWQMLEAIGQAAEMRSMKLVVFSGGECFMLEDELVIAVARATELGLASRCVTNGYWAKSPDLAIARLAPLYQAGLREINFSTGDHHQKFVPVDCIAYGSAAAIRLGMNAVVVVERELGRSFEARTLLAHPAMLSVRDHPNLIVFDSPWMPMEDRSSVRHGAANLVNRGNLHRRGPCDSVLDTLVVNPRGEVGACCGLTREQIPELRIGTLEDGTLPELAALAGQDFLKIWLAVEGPEQILAWAATIDPAIDWENRYNHHCDACRAIYDDARVRKVISAHWRDRRDDILFRYRLAHAAYHHLEPQPSGSASPMPTAISLREETLHYAKF
jgi:hypothetical protein